MMNFLRMPAPLSLSGFPSTDTVSGTFTPATSLAGAVDAQSARAAMASDVVFTDLLPVARTLSFRPEHRVLLIGDRVPARIAARSRHALPVDASAGRAGITPRHLRQR